MATISPARPPRTRTRGLTLLETMCACSVLAVALGVVAPGMRAWQDRQSLLGTAAELETDLQFARSAAVARHETVRFAIQPLGTGGSCYMVHTGLPRQCVCTGQGTASCQGGGEVLRLVELPAQGAVHIGRHGLSLAFDGHRGTVTPTATIQLMDDQGTAIHQIVNLMGRVRSCSPLGAVSGIRAC